MERIGKKDDAQGTPFTPASPGSWSPAPTNVQEALDQLKTGVEAATAANPDAEAVTYDPATPDDWSPAPTNVQEALDQLRGIEPPPPQDAANVPYDPIVPGSWSPAPSNVQAALDQLGDVLAAIQIPAHSYLAVGGGQSINLAADDHIVFSNTSFTQGTDITFDDSSPYTNGPGPSIGRFTLAADKTYRLTANPVFIDGGDVIYQWYDVTNSQYLGPSAARYDDGSSLGYAPNVVAFVRPLSPILVEVRFRFINGVTFMGSNPLFSWATIETLP